MGIRGRDRVGVRVRNRSWLRLRSSVRGRVRVEALLMSGLVSSRVRVRDRAPSRDRIRFMVQDRVSVRDRV